MNYELTLEPKATGISSVSGFALSEVATSFLVDDVVVSSSEVLVKSKVSTGIRKIF